MLEQARSEAEAERARADEASRLHAESYSSWQTEALEKERVLAHLAAEGEKSRDRKSVV